MLASERDGDDERASAQAPTARGGEVLGASESAEGERRAAAAAAIASLGSAADAGEISTVRGVG